MFPSIDWSIFSLEIILSLILVGCVILDILLPKNTDKDWLGIFSFLGILVAIVFWLTQRNLAGTTFNGIFLADSFSWFFKSFFLMAAFFVLVMTQQYFKANNERTNVFYLLVWLATIGMCLVASSADFLVLFISMEIMTLSFYVMTAYLKSNKLSIEAGMKYLILGALSSGLFLYGISLLYGMTHSTRFDVISFYASNHELTPAVIFALVLIFSTIADKMASNNPQCICQASNTLKKTRIKITKPAAFDPTDKKAVTGVGAP